MGDIKLNFWQYYSKEVTDGDLYGATLKHIAPKKLPKKAPVMSFEVTHNIFEIYFFIQKLICYYLKMINRIC